MKLYPLAQLKVDKDFVSEDLQVLIQNLIYYVFYGSQSSILKSRQKHTMDEETIITTVTTDFEKWLTIYKPKDQITLTIDGIETKTDETKLDISINVKGTNTGDIRVSTLVTI